MKDEVPEQAVNEMRVIAKRVASMYMSTEAARMDCADILYEALEVVWRSQQAEIERLKKGLSCDELYKLWNVEAMRVTCAEMADENERLKAELHSEQERIDKAMHLLIYKGNDAPLLELIEILKKPAPVSKESQP